MADKKLSFTAPLVSRRSVLVGGAAVVGSYLAVSSLPSFAVSAGEETQLARFMRLSRLLVNHQLDPLVGARIFKAAAKERANLQELTDSLVAVAEKKQATIVEDFFDDIPEGAAKELAHWIIFAWYTGASSPKANAQVFAFELALTYQLTLDAVTIPSYGASGPNQWGKVNVPLSPMPSF